MQGADHIEKDGASTQASPAKSTRLETGRTIIPSQVSDNSRAKLRALAEAIGGPSIVRDVDGNGYLLTVERLQFIPLSHEDASA